MIKPGWTITTIAGGLGLLAGGFASAFTAAPQPQRPCVVYTPISIEPVEAAWLPSERLSGIDGWPVMTRLIVPYEPEEEGAEHESLVIIKPEIKETAETFSKPEAKERRVRHRPRHHRRHRRR